MSTPQTVGRYAILAELARGGAGVVYRALDPADGREVALKLLVRGQGATEHQRRRFQREVEALRKLSHPQLVVPLDAGEHRGLPYLVMDLLPGGSLQDRLERSGALSPDEAARVIGQVAEGLEHAHAQGILHRDVKPANVLLDAAGQPRLTDFGLAKDLEGDRSALSRSGASLGTPGFWPPEQAEGRLAQLGPRSDVYALGATLYALLTGVPPFQAPDLLEHLRLTLTATPSPPSSHQPEVDPELDAICLRCLEKDPADRYPSAGALARALERRGSAPRAAGSPSRQAWAAAAALVVVGAVTSLWLVRSQRPRPAQGSPQAPSEAPPDASRSPASASTPAPAPEDDELGGVSAAAREAFEGAMQAARAGDAETALTHFGRAIELEPEFAHAFMNRGATLATLERWEPALADLDRALALRPEQALYLRQRAVVRSNSGDRAGALKDLEAALAIEGESPNLLVDLSRIHHLLDDHARAIACLDRALALEPAQPDQLYFLRLRSHRALKDYEGMLRDYGELIDLAPDPSNVAAMVNDRATIHSRLGRHAEAIDGFGRALELGLDDPLVLLNRGQCYQQLGQHERALEDFERALDGAGPNHALAGEIEQRIGQSRSLLAEGGGS